MDVPSNSRGRQRRRKRITLRRRLLVERLTNRRVLAAITGTVFEDLNQSYRQEAGEESLPHRLVYLDVNTNASFDTGEPFAVADGSGEFGFDGLPDGDYDLRLFDGSTSQSQTYPLSAAVGPKPIAVADLVSANVSSTGVVAISGGSIVVGDFNGGSTSTLDIADSLIQMQTLPDGGVLVIGSDAATGESAWLADPVAGTFVATDLSGDGAATVWSDVVVDSEGHGLVIERESGDANVYAVDFSDPVVGVNATDLGLVVPGDTQLIGSATGNRSVLAWSAPEGLQLSLWSNSTASMISYVPATASDTTELLAFDDASGILVLRTGSGGVSVHDVNADFAPLLVLPEVSGPIALDGSRDLIASLAENDTKLKLVDVRNGRSVSDLDVDLSAAGTVETLQWYDTNSIAAIGNAGIVNVSLAGNGGHSIVIEDGQDASPVSFGVTVAGDNVLPFYAPQPDFMTNEDEALVTIAPTAKTGVLDLDSDHFVVLGVSGPNHGSAVVTHDGVISYQPDADFNGADSIPVMLHDGRGFTTASLQVQVAPVGDPPQLQVQLNPVAENIPAGTLLGPITIIDPDIGDQHELVIQDHRFDIVDNQLIFVGEPGDLDFEHEPFFEFSIYVSDSSSFTEEIQAVLTVLDANDPVTDITPHDAIVDENAEGAYLALLTVHDQDQNQRHILTVDDDRFVIEGNQLSLAPGTSLDYEAAAVVTVNVTATDEDDRSNSYTQGVQVSVNNVPEQAQEIQLSNESVIELSPGEIVGDVVIDGNPLGQSYQATVNDSRFEISGSTLKLVDGTWVERATQEEIEITLSVQDSDGDFPVVEESFVISVDDNPTPFHNDGAPFDVDDSGAISPLDVLIVINYLNANGVGEIENGNPIYHYDVNGDGEVSPLDVLLVINQLTLINNSASGTVGGEQPRGEQISASEENTSDFLAPIEDVSDSEAEVDGLPATNSGRNGMKGVFVLDMSSSPGGSSNLDSTEGGDDLDSDSDWGAEGVDASLESFLSDMNDESGRS